MSTIIKLKVIRNQKYTTVNLTAVEDRCLSWKAKGLHLYLLSRPDAWELRYNDLVTRSKGSIYSIRSAIKELVSAGYLKIVRKRASTGRWEGREWIVSEKAQKGKIDSP